MYVPLNSQIANCAFCDGLLGVGDDDDLSLSDEYKQVECTHCFEWFTNHKGEVRAFNESDVDHQDEDFDSELVFDNYKARRRYLSLNRGLKAVKIKS